MLPFCFNIHIIHEHMDNLMHQYTHGHGEPGEIDWNTNKSWQSSIEESIISMVVKESCKFPEV